MNLRFAIIWSIWIGAAAGLYCFIYANSPLYQYGAMACTFASLPTFFIGGARREEILDYCSSNAIGVAWAYVFIQGMALLQNVGMAEAGATGLGIGVITIVLCALHFIFARRIVTKVPVMFGAIACTFLVGIDKWPALVATLCFGVLLGYVCQLGAVVFREDGTLNTELFGAGRKKLGVPD